MEWKVVKEVNFLLTVSLVLLMDQSFVLLIHLGFSVLGDRPSASIAVSTNKQFPKLDPYQYQRMGKKCYSNPGKRTKVKFHEAL